MRELHRLNYVLVARNDPKQLMAAEEKSGMRGILVFYTKEMAEEFIGQQGGDGMVIPKQINGIDDLYRLAGPHGFKMYCVMDKENSKYEGEFFTFGDSKRLVREALVADPLAQGLAEWAEKRYGSPLSQSRAAGQTANSPSPSRPWWKFW